MGNSSSGVEDLDDNEGGGGEGPEGRKEQEDSTAYIDDPFDGIETLGYRVLGVQPNSPASKAGMVSFLDFLIGINGQMLLGSGEGLEPGQVYDDIDLPALLQDNVGRELEILVWNIKNQQARKVLLTPADDWGGAGLLGVTIRLDNYAGAETRLIRVLTVEPKSPAAVAGLVPESDYLLGSTTQTFESVSQLAAILQQYQDAVLECYVYNTDSDVVRVVALMPTYSWGGGGLLGAECGTGYLHRFPARACQTPGVSVERKVRYRVVPPPPPGPTATAKQTLQAPANSNSTSSTGEQQQQQQEQQVSLPTNYPTRESVTESLTPSNGDSHGPVTVLELEPQLEMEVAGTDDDDDD